MRLAVDSVVILEDDIYRIVGNDGRIALRNLETGETSSIPLDVAEVYVEPIPEYFVDTYSGDVWRGNPSYTGVYTCITVNHPWYKGIPTLWNDTNCRPFSSMAEALRFVVHEMEDGVQDNVEKAAVGTRVRYRSDQEFRVEESFDGSHVSIVNLDNEDDRRSVFSDELEVIEDS